MAEKNEQPKKRRSKKKIVLLVFLGLMAALALFIAYFFLTMPDVSSLVKENPKTTAMIELRKKEAKEEGKPLKIRQFWVSYNAIPRLLKQTVIASEDAAFYQHDGIDYFELKEAIKKNMKEGKKSRGGSTITQQLAKNLYLSTEKSYYRKLKELFIARKLEKHLTKDRIFHIYLNVIEFGPGIFGVEAASRYYFGKSVGRLSLQEIVRLVSVIPKPLKVSPISDTRYLKWRARLLLTRMVQYHHISQEQYKEHMAIFKR